MQKTFPHPRDIEFGFSMSDCVSEDILKSECFNVTEEMDTLFLVIADEAHLEVREENKNLSPF